MDIVLRDPKELRQSELNAKIYNPPAGEEYEQLKASIAAQGILEPIVTGPDGTIVSGHRRWKAACDLELPTVPVITRTFADEHEFAIVLVEHNRQRKKTFTEMMNEAAVLHEAESERAKQRQQMGRALALGDPQVNLPEGEKGSARKKVADRIGVGERTYYMMTKIAEAAKLSPHIAEAVEKLNRGDTTIFAVFKKVVEKMDKDLSDWQPKVYDLWHFSGLNPKYGQPHPGAIPGDIVENLLWYYTEPGDLVVDPFAGGGVTPDVCKVWGRRCVAGDIAPVRDDILKWDVADGMPPGSEGASLVFFDPPYGNMLAELYSDDSASTMSPGDFIEFIRKAGRDAGAVLVPGGKLALIIMKQVYRLPDGIPYLDWPMIFWKVLSNEGYRLIMRIVNSWPSSIWVAPQVERAKEEKRILPICGDLLVFDFPEGR